MSVLHNFMKKNMKSSKRKLKVHKLFKIIYFFSAILFLNSCHIEKLDDSSDEPTVTPTGRTASYSILNTDLSKITGTVTFIENNNNSTTIAVALENSSPSINNILFLRTQTANIGGKLMKVLNPVDGNTGVSTTVVSELVGNEKITYEDFLEFDGHITVGDSSESSGNVLAYVDLGPNELTGNQITYNLLAPDTGDFMANATFKERKNHSTAVRVDLIEYKENVSYPTILLNPERESLIHLSAVQGKFKGNGFSELKEINGNITTYKDLIAIDAILEVYYINELGDYEVIARGGIGINPTSFVQ